MLKSDDLDVDLFFDSVDCFRSGDSVLSEEESCSASLEIDYDIWKREPVSVVERRNKFLRGMGITEFLSPHLDQDLPSYVNISKDLGVERIAASSGAVTSRKAQLNLASSGRELDIRENFVAREHNSDEKTAPQELENATRIDGDIKARKEKIRSWWNRLVSKTVKNGKMCRSDVSVESPKASNVNRMKVRQRKKSCREFTAVYMGQEIQAHKGFIWTMKFSPDGQYLASGGEDGVVRIWHVTSADSSPTTFTAETTSEFIREAKRGKLILGRKRPKHASVVIPRKVFKIEESPMQELHGHASDVLDLCWSNSNCLLSSSKDKTVRLWQVGCDECLQIFHHKNYVTCIQFNPVDDEHFISGSIDGKVRIWRVSESRVVNWADVREIITAICYQPDGQGFVVGSITGRCRFYEAEGDNLQLDAQISIQGGKKSSSKRITGFQFSPEDSQRVLIASADSKVRIFDGVDMIHKYRGLRKSGSQMSASFTPNGTHIISLGEDSRVYVWNYDGFYVAPSKHAKTVRSCEHFFLEGVSVAIPWSGMEQEQIDSSFQSSSQALANIEATSLLRDSERFSLGGWFSMDGRLRGSTTWPEEKLPLWDVPDEDQDRCQPQHHSHQQEYPQKNLPDYPQEHQHHYDHTTLSATWGLVLVTGSWDGIIRTFHNYGLPVRV